MLVETGTTVWVSAASVWEIAIKHARHPTHMPVSGRDAAKYFRAAGYHLVGINAEHVVALETLPAVHQDPFDRILVAQAFTEPLRLVTHDRTVAKYSDTIIAV